MKRGYPLNVSQRSIPNCHSALSDAYAGGDRNHTGHSSSFASSRSSGAHRRPSRPSSHLPRLSHPCLMRVVLGSLGCQLALPPRRVGAYLGARGSTSKFAPRSHSAISLRLIQRAGSALIWSRGKTVQHSEGIATSGGSWPRAHFALIQWRRVRAHTHACTHAWAAHPHHSMPSRDAGAIGHPAFAHQH